MVAEVKKQQKLTRANSLKKEKKSTKARLDHAAARVVKSHFPVVFYVQVVGSYPCDSYPWKCENSSTLDASSVIIIANFTEV